MITSIHTDLAPLPLGHYAQATIWNGTLHLSNQLPIDPARGRVTPQSDFATQFAQLLQNCRAILAAARCRPADVVSLTVSFVQLEHWDAADRMLGEFFADHRPARSMLNVAAIRKGYAVQLSLIAAVRPTQD